MHSKLTIWNMALGFIGTRTVASEEENTLEAVQCNLYYDNARRQALRDYPWNFAQRRAWLAQVPLTEGYEKEYAYAYTLPEDTLHARQLYPDGNDCAQYGNDEASRFILAYDNDIKGRVLLCNTSRALLAYTADIEDVSLFDDLFVTMLARKLAAMLCVPLLKNNAARVAELEELYRMSIPNAMQADMNEGKQPEKPDTWLLARGMYDYK